MKSGKDFFHDCTTLDQVKVRYKQLALKLHPDKAGEGSTGEMQQLNTARDKKIREILRSEGRDEGELSSVLEDLFKNESLMKVADKLDKEMEAEGLDTNNFGDIFKFVASRLMGGSVKEASKQVSDQGEKKKLLDDLSKKKGKKKK